jgi:hypothetical protein
MWFLVALGATNMGWHAIIRVVLQAKGHQGMVKLTQLPEDVDCARQGKHIL